MQAPERSAVADTGKGGRILLVDDRQSSYERLATILAAEHTIDVEPNPTEALFHAAEGNYDLLIVSLDLGRRWTGIGFVIFVTSSVALIGWGFLKPDAAGIGTQNVILLVINLIGVYRYLIRRKAPV